MYQAIGNGRGASSPDAAAVMICDRKDRLPSGYRDLDKSLGGMIAAAIGRAEFKADRGAVLTLYPSAGSSRKRLIERLYIVGLGPEKKLDSQALRLAGAALMKEAAKAGVKRLTVHMMPGVGKTLQPDDTGRALGEGMTIGRFSFDAFKGKASSDEKTPSAGKTLAVKVEPDCLKGFERGCEVGASVNLARELAATPPNVANPAYLVKYCRSMARRVGLKCGVVDARKAKELGMGGLSAVGGAGSTPPAMIVLEHRPTGAAGRAPVLLVGKAVTFDTGGYSLKINNSMLGMKYDKCGGMAVIGAMHAVATLKMSTPVVGVIAAAENMVDSSAYRPNDILTMVNGVTVEVTNTDAEGRLVLADALAYGCKQFKPQAVIDLATLTGGVVVALGSSCAGCFCGDTDLRSRLFNAGDFAGERLWHLPLWDEHRELMKGSHSDLVNSGAERGAHPIQGAAFLSWFATPGGDPKRIGEIPWAHLDIAGVADVKNPTPLYDKGPTGFGVSLLTKALEGWK